MDSLHGVRLRVSYDGTAFAGFVRQPDQRTVQGELERAIAGMAGAAVLTRGCSRTDAGVHALDQVVAFDSPRAIPDVGWVRGLNQGLPSDVVVRSAEPCAPGTNPRFESIDKTYRYLFLVDEVRDPLLRDRAWQVSPRLLSRERKAASAPMARLDLDAMREACSALLGRHDFRAFRASEDDRENSVRTISGLELEPGFAGDPRLLAMTICGDAFMKNMVRIVAGTLLEVARGARTAGEIAELLGPHATRSSAGPTAPAHGLTLLRVRLGRGSPDQGDGDP